MRINQYPKATKFDSEDVLIKDGTNGTKAILYSVAGKELIEVGLVPEMHRNLYRGKNLGSVVTEAQKSAIKNGTFTDLFVGDYWDIGGRHWVIADMDYFYNNGDNQEFNRHHLVMLPRTYLYDAQMNTD